MKYIIDTEKIRVPKKLLGVAITGVDPDEQIRVTRFDIDRLEELTESYIFEHFGERIGEAEDKASKGEYQRGLEEGKKRSDYAYQRGLSDGREKLLSALIAFLQMDADTRREWFGFHDILDLLVYLQSKLIVEKTNASRSDSDRQCAGCIYEAFDKGTVHPCDYCAKKHSDYQMIFEPYHTISLEPIERLEKLITSSGDGKEQ